MLHILTFDFSSWQTLALALLKCIFIAFVNIKQIKHTQHSVEFNVSFMPKTKKKIYTINNLWLHPSLNFIKSESSSSSSLMSICIPLHLDSIYMFPLNFITFHVSRRYRNRKISAFMEFFFLLSSDCKILNYNENHIANERWWCTERRRMQINLVHAKSQTCVGTCT